MARSGGGKVIGVIALLAIGALAQVPAPVWVLIGVGVVGWLIAKLFINTGNAAPKSELPARPLSYDDYDESPHSYSRAATRSQGSNDSSKFWLSAGKELSAGGLTITSGMVYFGSGLNAVSGYGVEPALIDPKLAVRSNIAAEPLPYWPSYSSISPAARGVYLGWLASGRSQPIDIGYVFLFFYGLERRLLADLLPKKSDLAEVRSILEELHRLIGLYGENRSFNSYATNLVDFVTNTLFADDVAATQPEPISSRRNMSIGLKLALGKIANAGQPLPADWAFAWLMNSDYAVGSAAIRPSATYQRFFCVKYREKYGDGIILPKNRTKLKAVYFTASGSFGNRKVEGEFQNLPDVSVLTAPLTKLKPIAQAAVEAIQSHQRYVTKNPDKNNKADALVLLPPQIWPQQVRDSIDAWIERIGAKRDAVIASFSDLTAHLPAWDDFSRDRMKSLASALEGFGVGIEPDPRWGGPTPEAIDPIVIFPLAASDHDSPSASYSAAALALRLGAMVAGADGVSEQEESNLERALEGWLDLKAPERARLRAHLRWLLQKPVSLTGLKKQIAELTLLKREALAQLLVNIAQADNVISPEEIKTLKKIYKTLGIDDTKLYSHAHAAATEPVTIHAKSSESQGYKVPPPPASGTKIDHAKVAALKADTEKVAALLGSIFVDEQPTPTTEKPSELVEPDEPTLLGLDEKHADFARAIMSRGTWQRQELEGLAEDIGVMVDGAVEKINEACIDQHGGPLLEGDDPAETNPDIVKELMAA